MYCILCKMDKNAILEVLEDWNLWKKEMYTGQTRTEYVERCFELLKTNVVIDLIGVRRSGKSFIMKQIMKQLTCSTIEKTDVLMVNFEDRRFTEFTSSTLDEIYTVYVTSVKPVHKPFVFLDEVQNVPQWERWVRSMHELGKAKIVISGSSSKLLSGELATVLTGRHLDVFVFPLSFREFLKFKGLEIKDTLDIVAEQQKIIGHFIEYLEFGGFPEVVLSENKKLLLLTYFDDILTKDIERRYKLKKSEKLRSLAKFYLTNTSNLITFNSLRKFLATTTSTIEKFSSYLEEVNVLFFVKRFSFKVKEQEKSPRKVYANDVGLANALGFKFSPQSGSIAENIVAIELHTLARKDPTVEVYYWRANDGREVDFIIKIHSKVQQLIQVCWNLEEYKTKEREARALLLASSKLSCKNLLILTEKYEAEEEFEWFKNKEKIKFMPLWKWLLNA